jgi:hypothetical protein
MLRVTHISKLKDPKVRELYEKVLNKVSIYVDKRYKHSPGRYRSVLIIEGQTVWASRAYNKRAKCVEEAHKKAVEFKVQVIDKTELIITGVIR